MKATADSGTTTPIAVVGMGCRFAGGATDPQALWKLLEQGGSAWSKIPSSRFNVSGVYHPNGPRVGSTHVRSGHFLEEDPALFDAAFFNMTSEVASCTDPQQRLILEVVYEALEAAGIPLESVAGSNTAVFSGTMYHDYQDSLYRNPETLPRYFITGNSGTMMSSRVSHFYDLRGPSVTVDTACSTTLTALHLAIQSLRAGESDMAIVAGSNLLLNSDVFVTMSNLGFLSPDGISYSFDPRANGYGRGEGVAAIILKALPRALRDGDPVRLVIRETALNQDGRSPAITTPSAEAQARLIRACYQKAGLDPRQTSYVEAHGTGTPTGDPLELSAISAAFQGQPLQIGSVKANLGHTEAASGLASVIKMALALEKGIVPPNARFLQPSKSLLEERNLQIPLSSQSWLPVDGICRASINNFGFGGANAHAIVERYDSAGRMSTSKPSGHIQPHDSHVEADRGQIYVLSAKDEQSCQEMISRLRDYVDRANPTDERQFLANMAYTLASRRSNLRWKAACRAQSLASLISNLESEGTQPCKSAEKVRLGWVFTGQGAQWFAMGRELIEAYPVFKEALLECDGYIRGMGASWTIIDELRRSEAESRVNDAEFSLPLSTAIQIALVRLLRSWGIRPAAITSHSSGEVAAAYTVGAFSARSAIGISYTRGALIAKAQPSPTTKGGMIAVGLSRSEVGEYITRVQQQGEGSLVVGCINSPSSVTVSGDLSAVVKLEELLHSDQIFARRLKVTQAFHSYHMQPLSEDFREALVEIFNADATVTTNACQDVVYTSPKTGKRLADWDHLRDPMHWVESMLFPVEFESSFRGMCFDEKNQAQGVDRIIEIGPHAALRGAIKQILQLPELAAFDISYLSCLSRGKSAVDTIQLLATDLIQRGYPVDVNAVNFPYGYETAEAQVLFDLPTYPWNHKTRYWKEPRVSRAARQRKAPVHDLIGVQEPLCPPFSHSWQNVLRISDVPWIRDHVVGSRIVFPGAGFISMAIDGLSQICNHDPDRGGFSYILRDVDLAQALILPAEGDEGVELRLTIGATDQKSLGVRDWQRFSVYSIAGEKNDWTEHCTGLIRVQVDHPVSSSSIRRKINPPQWSRKTAPQDLWASLHATGICHGPFFQNIERIESDGQGSWCTLTVADTAATMPHAYESQHVVHPTTLDSAIQTAYTVLPFMGTRKKTAMVPSRISGMKVPAGFASLEPGDILCAQAKMKNQSPSAFTTDVVVFNEYDMDGEAGIELEGLTFQSLGSAIGDSKRDLTEHECTCSSWCWAPDITLANSLWLEGTLSTGSQAQEIEVMLDLRRCTVHFIQEVTESLTAEDVDRLSGHLVKFYRWMQAQLTCATNGELGQDSADWLRDSEQERQSLRCKVVAATTNGEMICRLGPKLSAILRGELDPLQLMMDGQLLSRYYMEAIKWSRSNIQASELVRLCCHKNPRARIIEIGGGTGGCTQLVVNALGPTKPVGRYDFTDMSAGFFEAARKRFAEWQDVMDFRKLDIEGDPEVQGFDCGSYDVVLACQVLHATSNMQRTLNNVRKLLKPGGKLILVETTRDQLDLFFTFGLLPGWWLSEEPERQFTPSLTPEFWRSVLSDNGFSGVDLEARDCDSDDFYMISTMMSTATPEAPTTLNEPAEVLLVHADSPPPMDWLQNLQGALGGKNSCITSLEALQSTSDLKGKMCVFLGEMDRSMLESVVSDDFTSLTSMLLSSQGTLWVTRGAAMASDDPRKALHLGLLRTLRNESLGSRFVSLDLDPSRDPWTAQSCDTIVNVLNAVDASQEREFEYAERDGIIHVPRAFSNSSSSDKRELTVSEQFQDETRLVRLDIQTPGLLDSLHFKLCSVDEAWNSELSEDWVEIETRAFGLNFRDIMVAMGQLETNRVMGFECAGVVTRLGKAATTGAGGLAIGDRVCALMKGHWASRVRTARTNVVHIPEPLSFEQAASIPLAFTTAYISLYTVARLQQGEKVLIHGGAGGVGQAAIILAQLVGAEVFTTAGTQSKRDFLIDKFKLARDHVFSSREPGFVEGIKACTNGKGADVVLNSLAGPLLQNSFDCLANFGRFVEIGKKDLEQNSRLDMSTFARNVSFFSIDILYWMEVKPTETSSAMMKIIRLLEQKTIDLIGPISVYPLSAIEKAFRTMQSGQHVGKLVVAAAGTEMIPVRRRNMPVVLKPDASYLIVGGLGGIGRHICEWMVDHGARHLLILSRSGRTDPFVASLQERGCAVHIHSCDVAEENQLHAVLQRCHENGIPPIRGIIQAAMVLKDALVSQMTAEDFHVALRPKVQGSWNLHKIASEVDFFVMLSSLVGVMGGAGQANYAAAGAFQDALAQHRAAQGKPAVTIDLGMVRSIGYVAETDSSVAERLARIGYQAMHEEEVLAVLERAVSPSSSSASPSSNSTTPASPAVIVTGINTGPGPHWRDADWIQETRFVGIKYRDPLKDDRGLALSSSQPTDEDSVRARLSRASTEEEATAVVVEAMGRKLVTMFGLTDSEMLATQTLAGVGVDSLVAIELRNWITSQLNVDISVFELMEGRTIAEVSEVVVKKYSVRSK